MFVPRVLLKKGVRPRAKKAAPPAKAEEGSAFLSKGDDGPTPPTLLPPGSAPTRATVPKGPDSTQQSSGRVNVVENSLALGKRKLEQTSQADDTIAAPKKPRGRNITKPEVSDGYLKQVTLAIELYFSDYALWTSTGDIAREPAYTHMSALILSPLLKNCKPQVTHNIIQEALRLFPSEYVESATGMYRFRRKPSTYPLPSLKEAMMASDFQGASFWDCRTVYVEPDRSSMCVRPADVATSLKQHGELPPELLPIQAVQTLHPSCAMVVFSGEITCGSGERWLGSGLPKGWTIMTKQEHERVTAEYTARVTGEYKAQRRAAKLSGRPVPMSRRERKIANLTMRQQKAAAITGPEQPAQAGTSFVALPKVKQSAQGGTTSVAFPARWTFVRLDNMPEKLALASIFRLVKNIAPRPLGPYMAYHKYRKLYIILQFALIQDAEVLVQAFNDKVTALKEKGEVEKWKNGLNQGFEHNSWLGLPDKALVANPSKADRMKLAEKKLVASERGPLAEVLGTEEAEACWEKLQQAGQMVASGAPPEEE